MNKAAACAPWLAVSKSCNAQAHLWADALMYGRHLENPTCECMGRTLGPIEQNHAIMQQTPLTYQSKDENTVVTCMHNRNKLHQQQPSITALSYTVTFTQGAAALFLKEPKT